MIIALEGLDAAGKRTQANLLVTRALTAGLNARILAFPRYGETFISSTIVEYLDRRLGFKESLPPKLVSLLFAIDRFESLDEIRVAASESQILFLDRYIASNLAYQGAKVTDENEVQAFIEWELTIEHKIFDLPRADLTVYIKIPVAVAHERLVQRGARNNFGSAQDIYESNLDLLARSAQIYEYLAQASDWLTVSGVNAEGAPRSPHELADEVWGLISTRIEAHCR